MKKVITMDWKKWGLNLLEYSVPLFFGTLFAQLSLGVPLKSAIITSSLTLYGAISDYLKKRGEVTRK